MRSAIELLRAEARARLFFAVLTQSALGTGAAYVALLLVAYDRVESAWAISAVLIADLVAPMFLGPLFGAAADRWSRRACMVVADVVRAVAFLGIALVDGFGATVALALLAGAGTGLFMPASLAALPSLVAPRRLPAATALYGAIGDFGLAAGPALAALLLIAGNPETILIVNSITYAISAAALLAMRFGAVPARAPEHASGAGFGSLFRDARDGLSAVRHTAGLRAVLAGSALALFFGGLVNVAELPFLTEELDASGAVFSIAVALAGVGIAAGSLMGGSGGELIRLRGRFLFGLLVMGSGFLLTGFAPSYAVVFVTFTLAGFGNGMMLVHERLIIQSTVADSLAGRVFGTKDALTAWAFAGAFAGAGAAVTLVGPQAVIIASGAGVLAIAAATTVGLRRSGALTSSTAPPSLAPVDAPSLER